MGATAFLLSLFRESCLPALARAPPRAPHPRPRSYVFHYMVEDGITYLCLADEQQKRRIPFLFLQDIKEKFCAQYGDRIKTAISFAMNTEFARVRAGGDGNKGVKKDPRWAAVGLSGCGLPPAHLPCPTLAPPRPPPRRSYRSAWSSSMRTPPRTTLAKCAGSWRR